MSRGDRRENIFRVSRLRRILSHTQTIGLSDAMALLTELRWIKWPGFYKYSTPTARVVGHGMSLGMNVLCLS
jgi:hypothetical protein